MWICPTLQRPKRLQELAESWEATAKGEPLLVRLYTGDPELEEYKKLNWPDSWEFYESNAKWCGEALQEYFEKNPNEKQYGFIGDDIVLRTPGWAEKLKESAGDWRVAYPDDGVVGRHMMTHGLFGGEFLRALGFWILPQLKQHFINFAWFAIARNCNLLNYVEGVKFEHMHHIVNKAAHDETYKQADQTVDQERKVWEASTLEINAIIKRVRLAYKISNI